MKLLRVAGAKAGVWALGAVLVSSAGCAGRGGKPCDPSSNSANTLPASLDHTSTPATHRQAVDDLFEAMDMRGALDAARESSLKVQLETKPEIRQFESVMRAFLGRYVSLDAVREPLARLYMDRFSELELIQLAAFYRTPVGRRTLVEMPRLLDEGAQIGLKAVREHLPELQDMIQRHLQHRDGA